jgi:hypothetical protein
MSPTELIANLKACASADEAMANEMRIMDRAQDAQDMAFRCLLMNEAADYIERTL